MWPIFCVTFLVHLNLTVGVWLEQGCCFVTIKYSTSAAGSET